MKINVTLADMTPEEALHVVTAAVQASAPPTATGATVVHSTPAPVEPRHVAEAARPAISGGAGGGGTVVHSAPGTFQSQTKPVIDTSKIAAIAAANPAPAPKAEKPPAKPRGKKPADDADMFDETDARNDRDDTPADKPAAKPAKSRAQAQADEDALSAELEEEAKEKQALAPQLTGKVPAPAGDVAPELVNARKLRDVLAHLMEQEGLSGHEALKARCAQIKDSVPCLQRIGDLDSRIDRTLEVMDMGDDIS